MAITCKEASEMARKSRSERSKKNLEMIYNSIEGHVERGMNQMTIQGEYLLHEVQKELLDKGYTIYPDKGHDYDTPTGIWTIFWGYSDDDTSKLFNKEKKG